MLRNKSDWTRVINPDRSFHIEGLAKGVQTLSANLYVAGEAYRNALNVCLNFSQSPDVVVDEVYSCFESLEPVKRKFIETSYLILTLKRQYRDIVMPDGGNDDIHKVYGAMNQSLIENREELKKLLLTLLNGKLLLRKDDLSPDFVVDYCHENNVSSIAHHLQLLNHTIAYVKDLNARREENVASFEKDLIPISKQMKGLMLKIFQITEYLVDLDSGYTAKVFFLRQLYDSGKIDLDTIQSSLLEMP